MSDYDPFTMAPGTAEMIQAEAAVVLGDAARPKLARKARTAVNDLLKELGRDIAVKALEPLLTDEVLAQLQHVADEEAARQLAAELAGTEEPQQLRFPTLKHFVDLYICHVYRRDISHHSKGIAWCPTWWIHGEAFNRLDACWSAFEHLRLDGTTGMSTFWLQHLDPHMAVLLDPERGPFKFCSVKDGHSNRLKPLNSPPAPETMFRDYERDEHVGEIYETADGDADGDADDRDSEVPVGATEIFIEYPLT
ncbi:DUF4913 domain-containing protein [Nocardia sp. NPDC003693]